MLKQDYYRNVRTNVRCGCAHHYQTFADGLRAGCIGVGSVKCTSGQSGAFGVEKPMFFSPFSQGILAAVILNGDQTTTFAGSGGHTRAGVCEWRSAWIGARETDLTYAARHGGHSQLRGAQ